MWQPNYRRLVLCDCVAQFSILSESRVRHFGIAGLDITNSTGGDFALISKADARMMYYKASDRCASPGFPERGGSTIAFGIRL